MVRPIGQLCGHKHLMHHLRQFTRQYGRDAAASALLYSAVVATCFWGGNLLAPGISVTLNFTVACLCLAHVVQTNFFGRSEFCLNVSQRIRCCRHCCR